MKNKSKLLGILIMTAVLFAGTACSKDDDPADSDIFIGTYRGSISFTDGEENISDADGRVTVAKVGNSYNFDFGTGIPNITGVRFEKDDDGTYVSIGEGLTGITISAGSLNMLVTNERGTWTADCSR
ncbi:hypothetical protein EDD80_103196 [Anseongella ginsenosidimutans]|uniref:Lipocalin-like protein n=1 Tax=Anseongella ginsenosidimutans TaxID=496056 RepID=A0A4V2UTY8_9SPHI|nr:hypothetical protein [Anseongella ginsenosidimutans]QEC53442.1 hypothetical protein FRZ59_14585 [Anseongella ginsenosidimutans]TCS88332.1 hypothetical protein EDD80_103196 [Anseongella ginsenosidimutans]